MSPFLNRRRQTLKLAAMLVAFCLNLLPFTVAAQNLQKSTHPYIANLGSQSPQLDVYRMGATRNAAVLIYVHGGAWTLGSKSAVHDMPVHFTQQGFVFVSVDYRLVPRVGVQDQLGDIDNALGWITQNITRFGGNPSNLHLMGHSAGAHLVAMTGVAPQTTAKRLIRQGALRSVIANDTHAYDLPRIAAQSRGNTLPKLYRRVFGHDRAFWQAMSPIHHLDSSRTNTGSLPAFLLLYSGAGNGATRQDFARDFARALRKSGAQTTLFDGRRYSHREINNRIGRAPDLTSAIDGFLAQQQE